MRLKDDSDVERSAFRCNTLSDIELLLARTVQTSALATLDVISAPPSTTVIPPFVMVAPAVTTFNPPVCMVVPA